jgi:hypothetical protein
MQGKSTSKNLPQDWIEDLVWKDCLAFINQPGKHYRSMEAKLSVKVDMESETVLIQKSIDDKDIERQSILDLFRKSIIIFEIGYCISDFTDEKIYFIYQKNTEVPNLPIAFTLILAMSPNIICNSLRRSRQIELDE